MIFLEGAVERLLELWDAIYAWAIAQPVFAQVLLGVGLLAVLYFAYVVIAIAVAALYATFFR